MPDGRTKQCAGNLPDGTAFIVSCPANGKRRWPLVLQLSSDGVTFDQAILLRSGASNELPSRRYEGRYKTIGYNYLSKSEGMGKWSRHALNWSYALSNRGAFIGAALATVTFGGNGEKVRSWMRASSNIVATLHLLEDRTCIYQFAFREVEIDTSTQEFFS